MPKSKNEVTTQVIELTPDLASKLLESGVERQRHLSRPRAEAIATAIKNEDYPLTGEPLIMDSSAYSFTHKGKKITGRLLDGQHRCAAVVIAEKSISHILLVTGVDASSFVYLDTGKARTGSDVLQMNGFKNTNVLSAVARMRISHATTGELHSTLRNTISNAAILEEVRSDEDRYVSTVRFYSKQSKYAQVLGLGSSLAGLHMILIKHRVPLELVQEFADALLYGESLKREHPIHQLRTKLQQAASSKTIKLQIRARDAMLILCWNYFVKNRLSSPPRGKKINDLTKWDAFRDEYPNIAFK